MEPSRDRHEIELKIPAELFAVTDEACIEEVFENLILNSLEAMFHKKGKLTIEAETTAGETVIKITDTGCGMSKSFIEKSLFHPFKTTKKNGIGLGLYTCREVLRLARVELRLNPWKALVRLFASCYHRAPNQKSAASSSAEQVRPSLAKMNRSYQRVSTCAVAVCRDLVF